MALAGRRGVRRLSSLSGIGDNRFFGDVVHRIVQVSREGGNGCDEVCVGVGRPKWHVSDLRSCSVADNLSVLTRPAFKNLLQAGRRL